MDEKLLTVMEQSLETMSKSMETNKYICDSYRKIIRQIVIGFTVCIIVLSASNIYSTYKTYDYEGYPETEINNTNTNTNDSNSGEINREEE